MSSSVSRTQRLLEMLPSVFEAKKPSWPNPKDSVGQRCTSSKGLYCWHVTGPALEAMRELSEPIVDLLNKHQDLLEQGESKPRAIAFHMWMIGSSPDSAEPTIVFRSRSTRQRKYAQILLDDSGILDNYPGIKTKALAEVPAVYQSAKLGGETASSTAFENGVFTTEGEFDGPCGAPITFGHVRLATMGGVLLIKGIYYGISAQHARLDSLPDLEESADSGPLCFDDESDTEDDDLINATSRGSMSSNSDGEVCTDWTRSSPAGSLFDEPYELQPRYENHCNALLPEASVQSCEPLSRRISDLPIAYVENDLDYEIFQLDDPHLQGPNSIRLPGLRESPPMYVTPSSIMRDLVESHVCAATGTTGPVNGTILQTPYFIKMEHSKTFQEMWAVKLDRRSMQGDCGAWVIESSTGKLCGHIVAGCPITGMAYIIPAYKVFEDIEQRFGSKPLLPIERSPSSWASLDGTRQLAPMPFNPQTILRLVMAWLLWCSQNPYVPLEAWQQITSSILSSKTFTRCLEALFVLEALEEYEWLLIGIQSPVRSQTSHGAIGLSCVVWLVRVNPCPPSLANFADGRHLRATYEDIGTGFDVYAHCQGEDPNSLQVVKYDYPTYNSLRGSQLVQKLGDYGPSRSPCKDIKINEPYRSRLDENVSSNPLPASWPRPSHSRSAFLSVGRVPWYPLLRRPDSIRKRRVALKNSSDGRKEEQQNTPTGYHECKEDSAKPRRPPEWPHCREELSAPPTTSLGDLKCDPDQSSCGKEVEEKKCGRVKGKKYCNKGGLLEKRSLAGVLDMLEDPDRL